jgi:hypothetical protein
VLITPPWLLFLSDISFTCAIMESIVFLKNCVMSVWSNRSLSLATVIV